MRIRIHRFLLLLLMLALPVQAFASVAMLGCALPQQAAMAQVAMADEGMAGCHEPEQSAPTSHNCKHCTACALASALAIPSTEAARIVPFAPHFVLPPAVSFSGFIPDGPERPPRPDLA